MAPTGTSFRIRAADEDDGERIDRVVAAHVESLSRSRIQRLIAEGNVRLDGASVAKPSQPIAAGQIVELVVPAEAPDRPPQPEQIRLHIVHEDDAIVVVDKPPGLVVHPGAGHPQGTLVNALLYRYPEGLASGGGSERPGIVHRLDKGTSGLLVVARTDEAYRRLTAQFAARTVQKRYEALVYGCPGAGEGIIDVALGRDRRDRTRVSSATDKPRGAETRWKLLEELRGHARLALWPRTGRTHQVRAHLEALHHPCIGDRTYAGAQWRGAPARWLRDALRTFPRPALHARGLCFEHPTTGEPMELSAPLPADMDELLKLLRRWRGE